MGILEGGTDGRKVVGKTEGFVALNDGATVRAAEGEYVGRVGGWVTVVDGALLGDSTGDFVKLLYAEIYSTYEEGNLLLYYIQTYLVQ